MIWGIIFCLILMAFGYIMWKYPREMREWNSQVYYDEFHEKDWVIEMRSFFGKILFISNLIVIILLILMLILS